MTFWRNSASAFWLSLTLPIAAAGLFLVGQPWTFAMIVLFLLPILDAAIGRGAPGAGKVFEKTTEDQVPCWFAVAWMVAIGVGARRASMSSWIELSGLATACGLLSATAMAHLHELAHRPNRFWRETSDIAFAVAGYPHYRFAHQLHHQHVGNPKFGSAAPLGTSAWRHAGRSYRAAFTSSLSPQSYRDGKVPLSLFRNLVFSLSLLAIAAVLQGRVAMFYIGYSIVSIFVVETVGYMQHYGIVVDSTRPTITAWDVDFWLSNCLLVNNGFHNAHHRESEARYLNLSSQGAAMPAGYFQMLWLALFPPAWFHLMDRRAKILLTRQRRRRLALRNQTLCDRSKV